MSRRFLSILTLFTFLFQSLFFGGITPVLAAPDVDGSANLNLWLTPTVPSTSIIGQNFTLDISLQNQATSDGDGYNPGFILSLPVGVSFVSAGSLGAPTRTLTHASGGTLVFFQTSNELLLKGLTNTYSITLSSSNPAGVFVNKNIGVLAYANDNIYGRGSAPTGSPPGTLTGGIDYAAGSGVSMADPTNLTFPANVNASTNLSSLPFVSPTIQFTPFDVTKSESLSNLIGNEMTTTLTVHGNTMGSLKHFHLQDIIPSNRAFNGFITSTGVNIGGLHVTYNAPSPGLATIDVTDITVPTGTNTSIQYKTLPLAYDIASYSGSTPVLNTGSVVPHNDLSRNTVTMHTGALALSGGPFSGTTWNNGTSDITVTSASLIAPRSIDAHNDYAQLSKSANLSQAVIGDVVTYTLQLRTAKNVSFTTNGTGTYISDILPDGMTYSGMVTSSTTSGTPLTFISATTNPDGDTTLLWRLNSGSVGADAIATVSYQAVVDGAYEGAGDTQYENTETLVNNASFFGTIGDGGLSGVWGMTDPSIIDTSVVLSNVSATVKAPTPTTKKHLISVTTPTGTVYDSSTGLPANIPSGSALQFAVTMDFPNVDFINPRVIDALPLLAGPSTSAYNIEFQTGTSLQDIYGNPVLFNTDDGITPSTSFNGLTLLGTTIPNASWVSTTPANNLEFQLNSGTGKKTFAILFTVNVLPTKPAGGVPTTGLVPLTNFAYSSFNDDTATPNPLPVMNIPFNVNFPSVLATKTVVGGTSVEAEKSLEYTVTLTNTGSAPAFLENITDTLPANMDFVSGSIVSSGSLVELPNSAITQSGNILSISFDTGSISGIRSLIPLDDSGTPSIKENIIVIKYTIKPNTSFMIQGGSVRANTVTLDYYASSGALSNGVNNLGPVSTSATITVNGAALNRSIASTSEADSSGVNLYVGEEVVYRTIITVPQGTLLNANYIETKHADLTFVSGAIIASSGALAYTGTVFSGGSIYFGDMVNSDTDASNLETIILETTYRVQKNASAGTARSNLGTFNYSSTSTASSLNVDIRKPTVTLTKVASPTTGDAGDTVVYTITVNNTSTTARAYDLHITDLLPPHLAYVTGSLNLGSFSGTDANLFTNSGGGNGLTLDFLPVSSGASFSFQALIDNTLRPADTQTNHADVIYDTLDDDNSLYEWTGSTAASAVVTVPDITLSHVITSTSLLDTTSTLFSGSIVDMAIGEHVFYTTTITFPEATATGLTLTQTLPTSMKFLSGYILLDGLKSHTLSNISISPNNVITFSLGDVDNTGIGAGTGITIVTEAVLLDNVANTAGSIKTSSLLVNYSEKSKTANTYIEVVEPSLSIVKDYSPNSGDAGDSIPTTLTITNTSLVYAYDVVLTDISASKLTPDSGYSGTILIGTLAPGEVRTYTYNSTINPTVFPGELLTGTASVVYTSYPGVPTDGERTYTAVDTDAINIVTPGSINVNLLTTPDVKIGDVSQYQIQIPIGEGTTNLLSLVSTLPAGMVILPGSINISTDPSVTYSGTVVPLITPDSDTVGAGVGQSVSYSFTGIVNTNSNNSTTEYITVRYDAVVLNSTDTNNGNTKSHSAVAVYDGSNTKSGTSLPVTVREPSVGLSVSNTYAYGYSVPYVFTLTNSGTSPAYDVNLSTILHLGVNFTGSITITNSGGAMNLVKSGNDFTIDMLPVNTGNPLIFTINGSINQSVPNYTPITLTGTVTYTSEPGSYVTQTSNILNTERTSGGGVNDYIDSNKTTSFILNIPLLDEAISVVDLNGGDGIIGDTFEYTVTLINTGNVALQGIPVTLDIPAGFTGFTIMSIPAGSSDMSNLTGGVSNAGYLSITGINIPIGASRTIVYRVRALTTVVPGTVIPTTATVGNSIEGAIGGNPSVPVTINAPRLLTSAIETDVNGGGRLLQNETIEHTLTITNSGTATGTFVFVTIPWGTGSTYISGSIIFQSGTLINTMGAMIDVISNTITFTIPAFPVGRTETIIFQSRATGPIGSSIQTRITGTADEGVTSSTLSNILVIVAPIDGPGGGGGSPGPTSIPPPTISSSPPTSTPVPTTSSPPKTPVTPPPKSKKSEDPEKAIKNEYTTYLAKKSRLSTLISEENTSGLLGITYPKTLPQTGKSILSRIKKLVNAQLVLDTPKFTKGGDLVSDDINFWLAELPKEDQSREEYIVLPSNGMIAPINSVPTATNDYTKLVSGREINVNTYLKTGVMTYPGTNNNGYGAVGNTVIFGHSSYWKTDSGRYKTHFQKIVELETGEEIWIYKRQSDGSYKRYRYITESSYDTKPTDTQVLAPGVGKNLTLFTCTPIGGISGRWIVKAKYIDEEKISLESELLGRLVPLAEKKKIDAELATLASLPAEVKKSTILTRYTEESQLSQTPAVRYFKMKLSVEYFRK